MIRFLLLIMIGVGALYYFFPSLDSALSSMVTQGVRRVIPAITGTDIQLERTQLRAKEGQISLFGLKMGNPEGFHTPSMFESSQITVHIDPSTLFSDPIVVREIRIHSAIITHEKGHNTSNLDQLQKQIETYVKRNDSSEEETKRRWIIESFYLIDTHIRVSDTALRGHALTLDLPRLHMRNIGKQSGGLPAGEAVNQIVRVIRNSTMQTLPEQGLKAVGKTVVELPGKAIGLIGDGVETVGEGLGSLIGD